MTIYLRIKDIQGGVNVPGYEGCIEVSCCETENYKASDQRVGNSSNRTTGPISSMGLVLNKPLDISTIHIWQDFFESQVIPEMTFYYLSTDKPPQCLNIQTFYNVLIARYAEISGASGVSEEIEFHFVSQETKVNTVDPKTKSKSQKIAGYNFEQARST